MKQNSYIKKLAPIVSSIFILTLLGANMLTPASAQDGDSQPPADIEATTASPGDREILLQWDPTTDNVGVTGHKIYMGTSSVQVDGDVYDLPTIEVGNVTQHTVPDLTNGQAYYFTLTAVDAEGNESLNYGPEVNGTPSAGASVGENSDDGGSPQVNSVMSIDNITVKVVFSEEVVLPEEQPGSAFTIEDNNTGSPLAVQNAVPDSTDSSKSTILLTTAPQVGGAAYVLTAGIEVKDISGNPVISGTSDTGSFTGKPGEPRSAANEDEMEEPPTGAGEATNTVEEPAADAEGDIENSAPFEIVDGVADFNDRISVTFSKPVTLPANTIVAVTVTNRATKAPLEVKNVSLSVDGNTVYITTAIQNPVEYEVLMNGFTDLDGNSLTDVEGLVVSGKGASVEDLIPPEDVTDFVAKIKDIQQSLIELKWKESVNSAGDLADYMIYQADGKDSSAYGPGQSLGGDANKVEVQNLAPGAWYTFKVTAKDQIGNESPGAVSAIYLPETGPGMVTAGLTALAMGWYRRKKRK